MMIRQWGFDYEEVRKRVFNENTDKIFSFNSSKKRSTAVVHKSDGQVVIYVKGASEWVLKDCTHYLDDSGAKQEMNPAKMEELEKVYHIHILI